MLRRAHERPGGRLVYDLTDFVASSEQPIMRLGFWGARAMGPMDPDDHFSADSLALACGPVPAGARRRPGAGSYEFNVDGKSLRAWVRRWQVVVPIDSTDEPDLVIDPTPTCSPAS